MIRRHLLQCAAFAVVVWVEWMSLSVRTLDRATFDRHAIELERTRAWRYGYDWHFIGGVLVRARLDADAPRPTPVDATDTIAPTLVRELHKQQRTAVVLSVLYGSLSAIWLNGLLRIRRSLAREPGEGASRRAQRRARASRS